MQSVIENGNVRLKVCQASDSLVTEMFNNWASDEATFKTLSSNPITSLDATRKVIENSYNAFVSSDFYRYVIFFKEDAVGFITITPRKIGQGNDAVNANEIGLSIGSKFWRLGIGYNAIQTILSCLDEGTIVFATVKDGNIASNKLFEKCGFVFTSYCKRKDVYAGTNLKPDDNCYLYVFEG